MRLSDLPIRKKLTVIILLVSAAVVLLTCTSFFAYEFFTFRRTTLREVATLGQIVASYSTASLAFESPQDADEILSALKAERHIDAACLYDLNGKIFSRYPQQLTDADLPALTGQDGYWFSKGHLVGYQPVVQGDQRLGTLFLQSNMEAMQERFQRYFIIAAMVVLAALVFAYLLSLKVQENVSSPILALAETAHIVSTKKDYSIRAVKQGQDELGSLTDALNHMLAQIEQQNKTLRENGERVRAVLNSALSAVVVMDERGAIVDWNARAEKIFGWRREEAIGQPMSEMIIPVRYREAHQQGLKRFLVGGPGPVVGSLLQISALRRSGTEFPVELSINSLQIENTTLFCGFITDITERKRAEEALRESEERFRDMANSAPVLIWISGPDKQFNWFNQQWLEFVGRTSEQELGNGWQENVYPDDLRRCVNTYEKNFDARMPFSMEYRLRKHDGTWRWILHNGTPRFQAKDIFIGYIGSCVDITERKVAEMELNANRQKMENIVQGMGDAFVSIDRQWRYTFVNQRALDLMRTSKEKLIGNVLWNIFPDIRGTVFEKEYTKVMQERMSSSFETYYSAYDLWLEVRTYPYEDGIAIFYTDITKYKKAEEEIRFFNQTLEQTVEDRTRELEMANKELESFSYSVSHDLRAPLRSIHGYMNIFAEEYANRLDEEAKRLMAIILNNAKRMGQLIDDLLAFSKLGRKELVKANISMTNLVTGIWEELIKTENDRTINFNLQPLPDGYADSVTMKHVWVNLISNALKYTRQKNETSIEIGCQQEERKCIYFIKDNGSGFNMRYYDKLFGVFQRLHSQDEFEGTGVGLAIVKRIIARHGGEIWAEGKPDKGATFFFSLPAAGKTDFDR